MTRARTWLSIVMPFALACGISQAQPAPPPSPPSPTAPHVVPPRPPVPPVPPRGIDTGALKQNVDKQIGDAIDTIRKNPSIAPALRDKLIARMEKVRASVDKRVAHLDIGNLDRMGDELGEMGEEISGALDGIDDDVEDLGGDVARDVVRNVTRSLEHGPDREIKRAVREAERKAHVHGHHDDDDDDAMSGPSIDDDHDDDVDEVTIANVGHVALKQAQREQIAKLRDTAKATTDASRKRIDELSTKLHDALAKDNANEGEIAREIDEISAQEAAIRKAKILAWVESKKILDAEQRQKIESAAKPKSK